MKRRATGYRKKVLRNNLVPYRCSICGIFNWRNTDIVLEVHHKDGNSNNNSDDNLELLCPNCHSQTKGYKNRRARLVLD